MSVLILGAGGFLGRHLTGRLLSKGVPVTSLGFAEKTALPGERRLLAAAHTTEAIAATLPETFFDTVYVLAAAGVDPAQRQPAQLFEGNILLPQILLPALVGRARWIVWAGTCSEYFPVIDGHRSQETDPAEGADAYGASKAAGGLWARRLARDLALPLVYLRLFHFFGPGESPYRLVSSLFRQLSQGQPVPLSPGQQYRDLLYIEDLLDALEAAPGAECETYNVCSGQPVTVAEVARAAAQVLQQPETLLQFGALPYRPGEVMWIAGDCARFQQAAGWTPRWQLAAALAHQREALP